MIQFLVKGLLRDRHRSFFPIIIVTLGVMLTVLMHCWITGVLGDMIDFNARFATGHVKVMTRAYAKNQDQTPNDLALVGVDSVLNLLKNEFPSMSWVKRIRFGGLVDVPDENGETKAQGPAIGLAVDLLSNHSSERNRLNITRALVRGQIPQKPGEILISDEFAAKLEVNPGATVTLLSSTMYGSMALQNFTVAGTVQFGITMMDKGAIIIDIFDAQQALDMHNAASEVPGYFQNGLFDDDIAAQVVEKFNSRFASSEDEFAPIMLSLTEQNNLAGFLDYLARFIGIFIVIFLIAMSIVLWNAGLIGGLRRYGEVGVRLAIGEDKSHVYRSLIYESIAIGIVGSILGSIIGLGLAYLLQTKGFDASAFMKNTTMMTPSVYRAQITAPAYYIGFIPGLFSTVLGTMLSGIGIYQRKTAQLFKELEV